MRPDGRGNGLAGRGGIVSAAHRQPSENAGPAFRRTDAAALPTPASAFERTLASPVGEIMCASAARGRSMFRVKTRRGRRPGRACRPRHHAEHLLIFRRQFSRRAPDRARVARHWLTRCWKPGEPSPRKVAGAHRCCPWATHAHDSRSTTCHDRPTPRAARAGYFPVGSRVLGPEPDAPFWGLRQNVPRSVPLREDFLLGPRFADEDVDVNGSRRGISARPSPRKHCGPKNPCCATPWCRRTS